eukprot:TRINITY_DN7445_c0_g2_i1.p1 TRINITY_DN7445_c0_g2~~TRINITY_DN7445_c0_g2_i1.p1  ORF type:complete len:248 (+),score=125.35 TRINITY_DN7445_c0_g2_i1:53-745(+)
MEEALMKLEYPDDAKPLEVQAVDREALEVYATVKPECLEGEVKGVLCDCYGEKVLHLVQVKDGAYKVLIVEEGCKIMLEDVSPTQMVQYKFKESTNWMVGWMGKEAAIGYRSQKFKSWKEMVDHPSCAAAFKRLLQTGLVTKLYDTVALPTPPEDVDKWTVINEETGKKIDIPHPVDDMRVWDAEQGKFASLSPHLDGAPEDSEAEAYWENLLKEQKELHGEEYINELLK